MSSQQTTLGERLEMALNILHLSQARASTLTGVPQGTISHLVRNQARTYKNSRALADGLHLNHDWLVYGKGGILNPDAHYVPVIHDYFRLRLFLSEHFLEESTHFLITEHQYGTGMFATWLEDTMLICSPLAAPHDLQSSRGNLFWAEGVKSLDREKGQTNNFFRIHEKRQYASPPEIVVSPDKS